ncbi:MAG: hypothetical protein LN408_05365, partial [Candidatus Thermoplasmatota archaeon]|nr:hypothetical protein [Candidatus Thermoplasmatota archaeon]
MSKNIFVNKKINDIEVKMLRENEKCFIKIVPIIQKSTPKKLFIIINLLLITLFVSYHLLFLFLFVPLKLI